MITESEMIDRLKQDLCEAVQAMEHLAELLRSLYISDEFNAEMAEQIEEVFKTLNLDL